MTKGTRYTGEFKAKAVRLLAESRSSYSSETNAIAVVAKDLRVVPETLRRWRNQSDATVSAETRRSARETMDKLGKLRAENAELRRANGIPTTASAFSRRGSTRHGIEGRVHRRTQKSFRGRAYLQGPFHVAGSRVPRAARLPHVREPIRGSHAGAPRGAGTRHSPDPLGFLHGRVWVSEDPCPADRAGLESRGGRPRPGDADHARAGSPGRQAWKDACGHQAGEGTGDGPVRQHHGRIRRRRVQDRAGMETQTLPGFEGPGQSGTGDVPAGLVVELEAAAPVIGPRDTGRGGNRVLCKSSGTSRLTMKTEQ